MSKQPIRAAVIGAGSMGETHAKAIDSYDGTELVAIVDRSDARREASEHLFPEIPTYNDLNEMLEQESVDMIQDSTPEEARAVIAETALGHDVAVFGEKPTGPDTASARQVTDLVENQDNVYRVVHQERLKPGAQQVKQLLDDGAIGEVESAHMRLEQPGWYANALDSFRTEQIMDTATHTLDLLFYLAGDDVIPVSVDADRVVRETIDGVDYGMDYIGTIYLRDQVTGKKIPAMAEVYGQPQDGSASADYSPAEVYQEIVLEGSDGTLSYDGSTISYNGDPIGRYGITEADLRQREITEFVDAYNGADTELATAREEELVVDVAQAFIVSDERNTRIPLEAVESMQSPVYADD